MREDLEEIQKKYQTKVSESKSLKELDGIFLELFGKSGVLTLLPKGFSKLSKEELKIISPLFNAAKLSLEKAIEARRNEVKEESYKKLEEEELEFADSGGAGASQNDREGEKRQGHLHPLTKLEEQIAEIFTKLGFQRYDAPQIDSDYNNFEVLNIPEQHPARDLWDTLYIDPGSQTVRDDKGKESKLLLRTHTSNSQIRIIKDFKPPIRMMIIGRCYRYENLDARHEHTFEQFELVYIDKDLSMANLQYLSEQFFKEIFGPDIKARLKPKYYPFVEPGAGVDGLCIFCKGKGCNICGGVGWLELAGAGMIHPQVLRNGGIDPNEYSGIAWGFGPLRMAMIKYGVKDIRDFNSGELNKLEKVEMSP